MADDGDVEKILGSFRAMLKASDLKGVGDELLEAFKMLVASYLAMKSDTETEREARTSEFTAAIATLRSKIDTVITDAVVSIRSGAKTDDEGRKNTITKMCTDMLLQLQQKIDLKTSNIKDGETPSDSRLVSLIKPLIPAPIAGSPDTADDVRNKLEVLPDGEKLIIDAIEGLRRELDDIWKKIERSGSGTGGGVTGISGRGRVHEYDLSPKLDGVSKTFSIPAVWAVISVAASSTPGALRAGIDYTVDYSVFTITFTDAIDISTLEIGQTVILTVEDA